MLERSCERATFLCDPPSKIASGVCIARRTPDKDSAACLTSIRSAVDSWNDSLLFHLAVTLLVVNWTKPDHFEGFVVILVMSMCFGSAALTWKRSKRFVVAGAIAKKYLRRTLTRILSRPKLIGFLMRFSTILRSVVGVSLCHSMREVCTVTIILANLLDLGLTAFRCCFFTASLTLRQKTVSHLGVLVEFRQSFEFLTSNASLHDSIILQRNLKRSERDIVVRDFG